METSITASTGKTPSPLQLAYIGDAVWELHVRTLVLAEGVPTMDSVHQRVVSRVQASEQAVLWRRVRGMLSDEELDIARRARNAKLNPPRGVSRSAYAESTGFESVLGLLYWTGCSERLQEVMRHADEAT